VTAADRAGATTLLPRRVDARIPPLTRSIAVTLRSTPAAGSYDDAYFDSVSLVPRTDGVAPHAEPAGRVRPFLGATVISRRTPVDSHRRAWVRLACAASVVRRCRGSITLTARLAKGAPVRRVGRRAFSLRRGHAKRFPVPLNTAARRAITGVRKLRSGRAFPSARDGQGVTRTGVAIVRIVRGTGLQPRKKGV
jgi:hypothetical protein